jgi:hypothetical protein
VKVAWRGKSNLSLQLAFYSEESQMNRKVAILGVIILVLGVILPTVGVVIPSLAAATGQFTCSIWGAPTLPQGTRLNVLISGGYPPVGYYLPTWYANVRGTAYVGTAGQMAGSGFLIPLMGSDNLPQGTYTIDVTATWAKQGATPDWCLPNGTCGSTPLTYSQSCQITITPASQLTSSIHETQADKDWQRSWASNYFKLRIYNDANFQDAYYIRINGVNGVTTGINPSSSGYLVWQSNQTSIASGTPFEIYSSITGQRVMSDAVSGIYSGGGTPPPPAEPVWYKYVNLMTIIGAVVLIGGAIMRKY